MPAYNFMPQFAHLVGSGEKRQTIRLVRKRPTKPGDFLYLKMGMRTKECRDLLPPQACKSVEPILIFPPNLTVNGQVLSMVEILDLAWADGFETVDHFIDFFKNQYGFPFEGEIIKW
jgi:hypothetical protein